MKKRAIAASVICALSMAIKVQACPLTKSGGLTLMESHGARAAGLSDAFTAGQDDITGLGYNPASLNTLSSSQASFLYRKGYADDSFGQLMFGVPYRARSLGLSAGYYDAGQLSVDDGCTRKLVHIQTDLLLELAGAQKIGDGSLGVTVKYLSSRLADQVSATAYAGDLGIQFPATSRGRFGFAVQNIGTKLTYLSDGDPLPSLVRAGASYVVLPTQAKTSVYVDGSYYLNEREFQPAMGLETLVGPLSLRAGYRHSGNQDSVTLGAGFYLGPVSLDYAYGMLGDSGTEQRVDLTTRFGYQSTKEITKNIPPTETPAMAKVASEEILRYPEFITFPMMAER